MRQTLQKFHRSEKNRDVFGRFAAVGATIAVIDIGLLYLLTGWGLNVYLARIPSFFAAMTVGYLLNRYVTFHHIETGRALWHSLLRHYSVHSVGGTINYCVFAGILMIGHDLGGPAGTSAALPFIAVWIGGIVGLGFNFVFSRKLVFDN